jgi:acetyl-CoA decarbonylase/synthase complex subunit delta
MPSKTKGQKKIGLLNCSGACFPAILGRRACNVAAYKSDKLAEICFVEHAWPLLSGDPKAVNHSQEILNSYPSIITVSGCGSACATRLLEQYGITPREFHISEGVHVGSKSPPFKIEDIKELLAGHLEDTVELIATFADEVSDKEAVNEVILGAPKQVKVGGESKKGYKNYPVVIFEIFDTARRLPATVKNAYKDKVNDPVAWAKCCVKDYGAEMICLELLSTNPLILDRTADEAVRVVTKVLDAVDVPLMIGGSGDLAKDMEVLPAVAKATAGRRCLLSTVTLENYKNIIPAAIQYNHIILAASSLSLEAAMAFNRDLIKEGVKEDSIIMDLSTCPLGYGFEYSYSLVERSKLGAFNAHKLAQLPVLFCPANSWAARESRAKVDGWGDPNKRGPIWEMVAGIGGLMAGADLLLMLDPTACMNVKTFIKEGLKWQ